jgi:hypothetical protein
MYLVLFCCTMGGCQSDEIVAPEEIYGWYSQRNSGFNFDLPVQEIGNCSSNVGVPLRIENRGKNEVYLFIYCNTNANYAVDTIPKVDNLRIGKTSVDSISIPYLREGPYTLKDIQYGIFDQKSGKQVGYIAQKRVYNAGSAPNNFVSSYILYIPNITTSNTNETLKFFMGYWIK